MILGWMFRKFVLTCYDQSRRIETSSIRRPSPGPINGICDVLLWIQWIQCCQSWDIWSVVLGVQQKVSGMCDLNRVHRALYNSQCPSAIVEMLVRRAYVSARHTRAAAAGMLELSRCRLARTQRDFAFRAASSWNCSILSPWEWTFNCPYRSDGVLCRFLFLCSVACRF